MSLVEYELFEDNNHAHPNIQFVLLSDAVKRRMSVCKVEKRAMYQKNIPTQGGVLDLRMGSTDRKFQCTTCCHDLLTCSGHYGHIELPTAVYHCAYIAVVHKLLSSLCFFCCRICLLTNDDESCSDTITDPKCTSRIRRASQRFQSRLLRADDPTALLYDCSKHIRTCAHCGGKQPLYVKQKLGIQRVWDDGITFHNDEEAAYCARPFTSDVARDILKNMSSADVALLGFRATHPMAMVFKVLLVMPPCVRPTISNSTSRSVHHFTTKYVEILRFCDEFRSKGTSREKIQYHVSTLFNNSIRGVLVSKQRSGLPTKDILSTICGKRGRIRENLMGKRVNYSGRCVISPDIKIDVMEIGIPEKIAAILSFPDRVQRHNIRKLQACVREARANVVHRSDGQTIYLQHISEDDRKMLRLQHNDIVERHLENGDIVLVNRQPTLHRMSLMAHHVRVMPGFTFRLNPACCGPYNADFDGEK